MSIPKVGQNQIVNLQNVVQCVGLEKVQMVTDAVMTETTQCLQWLRGWAIKGALGDYTEFYNHYTRSAH